MRPHHGPCFFVLGYGRSGTTLLRRMLSAHPRLFVPPENDLFQRLTPHLRRRVETGADLDRVMAQFPPYYDRIFDIAQFRDAAAERLPLDAPDFLALLNGSARIGQGKSDAVWGHKRPSDWAYLASLRRWYPQARYIHVVRHPQDSTSSMVKYQLQSYPTTPLVAIWQWRKAFRAIRAHGRMVGPDRYTMLRYEDLIADPESELARLCRFLGVPETDVARMIDYKSDPSAAHVDPGAHMERTKTELTRDRIGAGAAAYSARQMAMMDHIVRTEQADLGYAPRAGAPIGRASALAWDVGCHGLDLAWAGLRATRQLRGQP